MLARIILAISLLSSLANAETLTRGPSGKLTVHRTTADRIVAERQLVCDYSRPRFEALPDGRTVVIMGKVCTEVSR